MTRSLLFFLCFARTLSLLAHAEEPHWAFLPPKPPPRPALLNTAWCRGDLDSLALGPMEKAGLTPAPETPRGPWLRRVSLDLIGLPPSLADLDQFEADSEPGAAERVVARLLASPHFGERWASVWLDLARYADTQGYEKDNLRTIWAYRDWVIAAFNADLPFDQFTVEELAGDLLPAPTTDQLIATAFQRNTMTNTEGGTDPEEFRLKAVVDRVNTAGTVWLGLTLGCAQCHDHPAEAVSQRDYFSLLAFFNNTADANRADDAPTLSVVPLAARQLPSPPETLVPIMRELTGADRRETHLWKRGNWRDPGDALSPATPPLLPPLPGGEPRDRLALARWLVAAENPLTARVMVNRVWAQLFGIGLVETEENFGVSGARPANQPLLDYLAIRYARDDRWSLKSLLREIVLSATYCQSSATTAEARARDPANRLLARGGRFRLSAEMVRDQALAVAGLLSGKLFGRSVMPPQPEGTWSVVYNAQRWITSPGEDRYRRALYTFWRRTSPYPSATLFDAPSRESCTARRLRTNSPAAALVTLNDPVFAEAAAALGRRLQMEGGSTDPERLAYGFRLVLARPPTGPETASLQRLLVVADGEKWNLVGAALLNLDETLTRE